MRLSDSTVLFATFLAFWLAGCTDRAAPAAAEPAMIFASASLTSPFEALADRFERGHAGADLELHFAGTPQLVVQVREGAPVDVFASADLVNMQRVLEAAPAVAAPTTFATNGLTIVTARGNPKGIESLADLARPDLMVALCGPEVPAGRYAREALAKAGVRVRSVSDEPSVQAVVTKVDLGELDAGIVYRTDAASASAAVDAVSIADEYNVVVRYSVAVLAAGRRQDLGREFVSFVSSAQGQAVLRSFGFSSP